MPFSDFTRLYLTLLENDDALMAEHTCHYGATKIVALLGTGDPIVAALPTAGATDGLYRLDISTALHAKNANPLARININFDHSLVVLKNGADRVVLQCFSKRYTMSDWMKQEGAVRNSISGTSFSPSSPTASLATVFPFWAHHLPRLLTSYNERRWPEFNRLSNTLFAAPPMDGYHQVQTEALDSRMTFTWRRYAFKALDGGI